ncbi:MAG: hypothetical protein FJZ57_04585 [Chlamydiae bacterium]|nr:hypothetical protein [Chlamydiota bacterium]
MCNSIETINKSINYFTQSNERDAVEELKKLPQSTKNELHKAFWIVSGSPLGNPMFGQRIEKLTGECAKKVEAIKFMVRSRPDLLSSTQTSNAPAITEIKSLTRPSPNSTIEEFPRVTCPLEATLKEITSLLLNNRTSDAARLFRTLPDGMQDGLTQHLQKNIPELRRKKFFDEGVNNQVMGSVIIDYVRTVFIPDIGTFSRRTEELDTWTKSIRLEESATISQTAENRAVTQWKLFPYDSTLVRLSTREFASANLIFNKYVLA